jgi:hypothetical protein
MSKRFEWIFLQNIFKCPTRHVNIVREKQTPSNEMFLIPIRMAAVIKKQTNNYW